MAGWVTAAREGEVAPGTVKVLAAGGRPLALCNVDGRYYAIDDVCTHDGGPLDQGELDGVEIECPRHGARFDVTTGRATCMPAVVPVKTYEVRIQDGEVQVHVP
jgi:3-phenylpropionate/trans-cinnamate dioxygenase ferredoxin component